MKSDLLVRDELLSQIHGVRFKIMQHYMFLYEDRLDGKPCRFDRYNEGKLVGTKEHEGVNKSLNLIHKEELKLSTMLARLETFAAETHVH